MESKMIAIPQHDGEFANEQNEDLGLEVEEEPIGIVEQKPQDKEVLRRQKTHTVLTDPQLVDLIGVKTSSNLDALGLKSDTVEQTLMGNLRVSLFWEEKIMLLIHALQIVGYYYVMYIEQVPAKYSYITSAFAFCIGKFDYIVSYPEAITDYSTIMINTFAWTGICFVCFGIIFMLYATGYLTRSAITGPYWLFKIGY